MPSRHTYLRTHRLAGKILEFDLGAEERKLQEQAASAKSGRAAKTLVKEGRLRITLVAMRKGAALGAHAVEGDVSLQVLRGAFAMRTKDQHFRARKGSLIALQAGVQHDAQATRDATILITASMR
jgi:quercetin dioxygenase-like cupin family protein